MHGWRRRTGATLLALGLLAATAAPTSAGGAPGDGCVPGTIWEDRATGITYICIYDELYGGTRWDILPTKQAHDEAFLYRSSTLGCVVGLTATGGYGGTSGGNVLVRSLRWPCATTQDRLAQPAGELRARAVVQRYSSGAWTTCRDSGYQVNSVATDRWIGGVGMGTYADCGQGQYRTLGFGSMYQGGAWRGGSLLSPSLWLR
jgi:hypothetical protein